MEIVISLEELTNQTVESIAHDLGCDTDEGRLKNISDESRLLDYSVEQSRSKDISVKSKNEQGRSMIYNDGPSMICEQGRLCSSQYKIENKIIDAIDSKQGRLKNYPDESRSINIPVSEEEFKKEWGLLTGV